MSRAVLTMANEVVSISQAQVDDRNAYCLLSRFLETRDDNHLREALALPVVRLETVQLKAKVLSTFSAEELKISASGCALAVSLANDMAGLGDEEPVIKRLPAVTDPNEREIAYAYFEWLFMERRLLAHQLFPRFPQAELYVPAGTTAERFHYPPGVAWYDVPSPATRAASVLGHVGAKLSEAAR